MNAIRIHQVMPTQRGSDGVAAAHLDKPSAGVELSSPTFEIAGWVVGESAEPLRVEIVHRGRLLRTLPLRHRPDIAARHTNRPGASKSGFDGLLSTLGLPAHFNLEIRVLFQGGDRARIATIRAERTPLGVSYESRLNPLILTTLGRTGSTWAMNLLAAHPEVVVRRRYPYECRTAKYWLQVMKLLSEPTPETTNERVHSDDWWIGPNPFLEWDMIREFTTKDGRYIERQAKLCKQNIETWYAELAVSQDKNGACYFAEKFVPDLLPLLARELYPGGKEVFLVRDFRDMMCSILAFDKKRGFNGFGRREGETTEAYILRMGSSATSLYNDWKSRHSSSHLIRYEDIVLDPIPTLQALFDHLQIDSSLAIIRRVLEEADRESVEYRAHATSSSARHSIGRWKQELGSEHRAILLHVFGGVLQEWGYDGTGEPAGEAVNAGVETP